MWLARLIDGKRQSADRNTSHESPPCGRPGRADGRSKKTDRWSQGDRIIYTQTRNNQRIDIRRAFWPEIRDAQSAKYAGKLGAYGAFVFATLAAFGAILAKSFTFYSFADALFFAGLGFGIWKMSRVCAVFALLLYISEHIDAWLSGRSGGALIFGILIVYFLKGIRGTYRYRKLRGEITAASLLR